jgi:heat-inducible transcriptional repressor
MTDAITARQTQILQAVVEEYIETASPVGSETLDRKFNLGISSATIRNEMVALTAKGYLRQPHTSSGRIPSPKALRFYIDQLMEEKRMSVADEVHARQEVNEAKNDVDSLMHEATHMLAQKTGALAVAAFDEDDRVWHSGYSNVFANPEFFTQPKSLTSLFSCLEQVDLLHELFFQRMTGLTAVEVVFGEDLDWPGFSPIGIVGTRFSVGGKSGAIAVVGPARLPYSTIIPTVRYFRSLFDNL